MITTPKDGKKKTTNTKEHQVSKAVQISMLIQQRKPFKITIFIN